MKLPDAVPIWVQRRWTRPPGGGRDRRRPLRCLLQPEPTDRPRRAGDQEQPGRRCGRKRPVLDEEVTLRDVLDGYRWLFGVVGQRLGERGVGELVRVCVCRTAGQVHHG